MKRVLFCFSLFCVALGFSQEDSYSYQDNPELSWDDFAGEPDLNSQFHANTNSGFSYSWAYSTSNGKQDLTYEVFSTFYPSLSWVHPDHKIDYLLAHEQLHFDISELHARKLRKAMALYKPGRSIRQDLKRLYSTIEKERVEMQNKFDAETNHSQNKESEAQWQEFVKSELKRFEDYSKS